MSIIECVIKKKYIKDKINGIRALLIRGSFFLFFTLPISSFSQSYIQVLDSLEHELTLTQVPDERLTLLSAMLQNTMYNDLDRSYEIVMRYEKEALGTGDSSEIARSKNFYGMIASVAGDHFRAIAAYEEAQSWYEALKDTFMLGMMFNNLGSAYEFQKDRENSIRYFQLAQGYFQKTGNQDWIFYTKSNIAGQYMVSNRLLEARNTLQECEVYFRQQKQWAYLAEVYISLAECAVGLDGIEKSVPYLEKVEGLLEYLDMASLVRFHILKCDLLIGQGRYSEAEFHGITARSLAEEYGVNKFRMDAYQALYALYKAKGDFERSLQLHERLQDISDSTMTELIEDQLINVMTKYEVREKNKELELKQKELEQSQYQKNLFITLLALIGLLLIGAVWFTRSKIRSTAALSAQKILIEKSLSDKELLLREIHHRVKNNMQVISSLLSIQSRDIKDEKALKAVNDSRNRVRAMALIHQGLYTEDNLRGVRTTEYITKLCNSLFSSYRVDVDRIKLQTNVEDLIIDVDSIVPMGLILNELITNALKYAFPENRKGLIKISLKERDETLFLSVADDGVGIAEERQMANEGSFGMKMIKAFSKKLDAEWEVTSEIGTHVSLIIRKYKVART